MPPAQFAFVSDGWRLGYGGLYRMNADGSDQVQLTDEGTVVGYPVWSPDGSKIAFCHYDPYPFSVITVMAADGTNQTPVYTATESQCSLKSWSPDSMKIAFSAFSSVQAGNSDIYVASVDGTGATRLRAYPKSF